MNKRKYQAPFTNMVAVDSPCLMAGTTTETLRFDPNEGTSESLSRRSRTQDWDED